MLGNHYLVKKTRLGKRRENPTQSPAKGYLQLTKKKGEVTLESVWGGEINENDASKREN